MANRGQSIEVKAYLSVDDAGAQVKALLRRVRRARRKPVETDEEREKREAKEAAAWHQSAT